MSSAGGDAKLFARVRGILLLYFFPVALASIQRESRMTYLATFLVFMPLFAFCSVHNAELGLCHLVPDEIERAHV